MDHLYAGGQITLAVKVLRGQEITLQVQRGYYIHEVLDKLSEIVGVPSDRLKLINKGKILQETLTVKDCNLTDGCKLTLLTSSAGKHGTGTETTVGQSNATGRKDKGLTFWHDLEALLAKHFTKQDATTVLVVFKERYNDLLGHLSLDDIERIASDRLAVNAR